MIIRLFDCKEPYKECEDRLLKMMGWYRPGKALPSSCTGKPSITCSNWVRVSVLPNRIVMLQQLAPPFKSFISSILDCLPRHWIRGYDELHGNMSIENKSLKCKIVFNTRYLSTVVVAVMTALYQEKINGTCPTTINLPDFCVTIRCRGTS